MLILIRRQGEPLVIDHDIRIAIARIKGGQARLAIDAPDDVDVIRAELLAEDSDDSS